MFSIYVQYIYVLGLSIWKKIEDKKAHFHPHNKNNHPLSFPSSTTKILVTPPSRQSSLENTSGRQRNGRA